MWWALVLCALTLWPTAAPVGPGPGRSPEPGSVAAAARAVSGPGPTASGAGAWPGLRRAGASGPGRAGDGPAPAAAARGPGPGSVWRFVPGSVPGIRGAVPAHRGPEPVTGSRVGRADRGPVSAADPRPVPGGGGRAGPGDHRAGRGGGPAGGGETRPGERSWPVDGGPGAARPAVLRGWRPPPAPWAAGHRGVDLAARAGQRVRAAAAGRVTFSGPVAGREVLTIELSGTGTPPLRTTYEPVRALVDKGDRVSAGQVVGVMRPGPFHCPAGCLHWGLRRGDRYLDPLSLLPPWMLRGGPSRLLPVFGVADSPAPAAAISPAGWTGLAPAAALAAASAWAHARLRSGAVRRGGSGASDPAGRLRKARAGAPLKEDRYARTSRGHGSPRPARHTEPQAEPTAGSRPSRRTEPERARHGGTNRRRADGREQPPWHARPGAAGTARRARTRQTWHAQAAARPTGVVRAAGGEPAGLAEISGG
ncbi:peptidoglycan DD-metalloendopeptidase family protein [Streptomyces sp. NA02950]|nr:peptidoglycan DD-metalloendopeptidase family protein [Streptomyces sp. NA02950]